MIQNQNGNTNNARSRNNKFDLMGNKNNNDYNQAQNNPNSYNNNAQNNNEIELPRNELNELNSVKFKSINLNINENMMSNLSNKNSFENKVHVNLNVNFNSFINNHQQKNEQNQNKNSSEINNNNDYQINKNKIAHSKSHPLDKKSPTENKNQCLNKSNNTFNQYTQINKSHQINKQIIIKNFINNNKSNSKLSNNKDRYLNDIQVRSNLQIKHFTDNNPESNSAMQFNYQRKIQKIKINYENIKIKDNTKNKEIFKSTNENNNSNRNNNKLKEESFNSKKVKIYNEKKKNEIIDIGEIKFETYDKNESDKNSKIQNVSEKEGSPNTNYKKSNLTYEKS